MGIHGAGIRAGTELAEGQGGSINIEDVARTGADNNVVGGGIAEPGELGARHVDDTRAGIGGSADEGITHLIDRRGTGDVDRGIHTDGVHEAEHGRVGAVEKGIGKRSVGEHATVNHFASLGADDGAVGSHQAIELAIDSLRVDVPRM